MPEIKVVSLLSVNDSYLVYIPKVWAKQIGLKKGDKMVWKVKNGNYETIFLKKRG